MANTKKEWQNMSIAEKAAQIFVNCFALLVAAFVTFIAYGMPVECKGLDAGVNIWCLVHPGTWADVIGWILLWAGCFWLSGIWAYFIKDDDEDPWKTVTKIAWGCCIIGPAIITLW